jgi:hypothetical protein
MESFEEFWKAMNIDAQRRFFPPAVFLQTASAGTETPARASN